MNRFSLQSILMAFVLLGVCALASCGLDDYIYLDPITTVTRSDINKTVQFLLPTKQDENCTGYAVYYKIYRSTLDGATFLSTSGSETIDTEINSKLYNDYVTLNNYISPSNSTDATSMYSIVTGLGFIELMYLDTAITNADKSDLSTASSAKTTFTSYGANGYLATDYAGAYFLLDFTVLTGADDLAHPYIQYIGSSSDNTDDGVKYRIMLNNNGKDFLFSDLEESDMTGTEGDYAYIMLYAFAQGLDTNLTTVMSRPCYLGVFQLPD